MKVTLMELPLSISLTHFSVNLGGMFGKSGIVEILTALDDRKCFKVAGQHAFRRF